MGDVGMAIQRAEDKTAQMQARAGAIDELMASGALDDAIGGRRDDIQSELDQMSASSDVERELSRLKGEITASAPKQLEGGANGSQAQAQASQAQAQAQDSQAAPQGPFAPPAPAHEAREPQQAQPAGLPVSDLPAAEKQDGEGS
jgi:phage shock protein A